MLIFQARAQRASALPVALLAAALIAGGGAPARAQYQNGSADGPAGGPGRDPGQEAAEAGALPVLLITAVEVLRTGAGDALDVVHVSGLTSSSGWAAPQLVPTFIGREADDVLDLQLVAAPAERARPADGFARVSAVLEVPADHPYKVIRVRGALNAVTLATLPGVARAEVGLDDCKACVGKRFVPSGGVGAGEAVVREENLPKPLRVLRPADGIRGSDYDPDRLTLVLDDKDLVVTALWE